MRVVLGGSSMTTLSNNPMQAMQGGSTGRTKSGTPMSSYTVRDLLCHLPQLGDEPIKLSAMLLREGEASERIEVHKQLTVHSDNRELDEGATFTFSLGGVDWSAKYGQPAERQPG